MKPNDEKYNEALEEYLGDGINYNATGIKCADEDSLQQLAADSFHEGFIHALARIKEITRR